MLNGQLKPGYNIQVGTENNFVIGYDVFPNPTDTRTFIPHLENVQKRLGCKFKFAIADAGYGSEENYDYLEENEIILRLLELLTAAGDPWIDKLPITDTEPFSFREGQE